VSTVDLGLFDRPSAAWTADVQPLNSWPTRSLRASRRNEFRGP